MLLPWRREWNVRVKFKLVLKVRLGLAQVVNTCYLYCFVPVNKYNKCWAQRLRKWGLSLGLDTVARHGSHFVRLSCLATSDILSRCWLLYP